MKNLKVSIPSNGSSLFQLEELITVSQNLNKSQSPQTGQVYFNGYHGSGNDTVLCLNPLKRVKFISIYRRQIFYVSDSLWKSQSPQTGQVYFNYSTSSCCSGNSWICLNPLKRVKFISIKSLRLPQEKDACLNPLKRVKFISMKLVKALKKFKGQSQSPQTGQVYFNSNQRVSHLKNR